MSPELQSVFNRMGALGAGVLIVASAFFLWQGFLGRGARQEALSSEAMRKEQRVASWLRLLITLGATAFFLTTPWSVWLWELLPFLHRVNMPWRLLDLVAAPAAALGGALVCLRLGKVAVGGKSRVAALAGVGLLALLSMGLDASREMSQQLIREAQSQIAVFGDRATALRDLAQFVIDRRK